MIRIALLIIITTTLHAAPTSQRLARTVPPEIAAMVISNAPPGAVISYRYHRAKPFDPARHYKRGDVVIAADGTPHIALCDVFPASNPPPFLIEPLLQTKGIQSSPQGVAPESSPQGVAPADSRPPTAFFRAINQPLTNAPAKIMRPLSQRRAPQPVQRPAKRIVQYRSPEPREGYIANDPNLALDSLRDRNAAKAKLNAVRIRAWLAEHGPRKRHKKTRPESAIFPSGYSD